MIDIKKVLTEHQIYWRDRGPDCAKGSIVIHCIFCGPEDKHEHMGIRLSDGYFGCWRNEKHRGKNIYRLLAVLGISIAEEKTGIMSSLVNRTYFNSEIKQKEENGSAKLLPTGLPRTFVRLDNSVLSYPYISYLKSRGFHDPYGVAKDYNLVRDYEQGKWSNRLIIPIWFNEFVCWTGRAINNNSLRYLSTSTKETINIKDCIFNYNELKLVGGETLIINEGPLDSIKIDFYLKPEVRATCTFGIAFSNNQIKLLKQICQNYNNILIGLDKGALPQALILSKILRKFSPIIVQVPNKDFGEMEPGAIKATIEKYT